MKDCWGVPNKPHWYKHIKLLGIQSPEASSCAHLNPLSEQRFEHGEKQPCKKKWRHNYICRESFFGVLTNTKHSFQTKGEASFSPLLTATWTNFLSHSTLAINLNKQFEIAAITAHQERLILDGVQGSFCNVCLKQLLIPHFHGDEISSNNHHQLLQSLDGSPQKRGKETAK